MSSPRAQPLLHGHLLAELLPIVNEISGVLDPEALLPAIARQLRRVIDYRILDIFLAGPDGTLAPAHVEGYDNREAAERLRIAPGQGLVGWAARHRETVFVPDVSRDARYIPFTQGVRAELAIPLVHRDRLVGVLNIEGPDPNAFTEEARGALQMLASLLAAAIQNATLYRETRWYAGLLATLYEIGKETASILDLDELLSRVAEVVKRVIDYETFGILLLDERRGELVLRKAVSYGRANEKTRIRLGEGLCGAAAVSKQPILVGDVRQDPRYLALVPETRSELVVPLIHKDRVVGVFDLESPELDRFTEEHVKVLTPLASQVAGALENARLYADILRKEERLGKELAIARRVQHGLFPEQFPVSAQFDASAHFLPANELGGDLYDFYEVGGGQLGLAVGDVAGKGVPAALYGAFASGTVRARAFERHPPADLLGRVNRNLCKRGVEGLFCTLAYAVLDFGRCEARIANSGLPYPLLYRAETGRCEPVVVPGLPLGAFEAAVYEEVTVPLCAGDVLVFHTDGVTEARRGSEDYGTARLRAQVETHAHRSAEEIGEAILLDLRSLTGDAPLADDVTLVVVKVR
ncbi:MAG TPA: SpoIIE family protein phosphatase [Vicinamibacteria bacterium]|nr:SpoIIE family protein phosphatase [Vicinamibacteria bacterium]